MAIISLGEVITNIRGSIGGTTFAQSRGGLTARTKNNQPKKTPKRGVPQKAVVLYYTRKWSEESISFRSDWDTAAATYMQPQRRNPSIILTGYEFYLQCHFNSFQFNSTYRTFFPSSMFRSSFSAAVTEFDIAGDSCKVYYNFPNHGTFFYFAVAVSNPLNAGRKANTHRLELLAYNMDDIDGYINIASPYIAKYGTPDIGSTIQIIISMFGADNFNFIQSFYLTTTVI